MDVVHGKITVAPDVLHTIARLTVLGIPGVFRLRTVSPVGKKRRMFQSNTRTGEGIRITLNNHALEVEIHLCASADSNMHELGQRVQAEVRRAMEEMVGIEVRCVDVHIDDVAFPEREPTV